MPHPIIGVCANHDDNTSRLHTAYTRAVLDAGGIPVIIPVTDNAEALREIVTRIDGLILSGGGDISGDYFGEKTLKGIKVDDLLDRFNFTLLRLAADRCLPVFGICRGEQVINAAFGGTLWQDIPSQFPGKTIKHSKYGKGIALEAPAHEVDLTPGTWLGGVLGGGRLGVNSRHHQAVKDLAPGFRTAAVSTDGVIEAVEAMPVRRIWGVQWHPENMACGGDTAAKALFRAMVDEARLFARAKEVHRTCLTVDSHTDTPMFFGLRDYEHEITESIRRHGPADFSRRDPVARVDLVKMEEGMLDAVFMVAYIPQDDPDPWGLTLALLEKIDATIEKNSDRAGFARSFDQADALKAGGRKAIFRAVENGCGIGDDLSRIALLCEKGVVYMTLCHNGDNLLCDSAAGKATHGGLSDLGRDAVREMNRLGMVVDLSHAAETTFYDVLETSAAPIIASHSSARALCDHPRNLTDDQLRALAAAGGVAQVCFYDPFLREGGGASVIDAVDHIDHMVRVAGIDHVGIGSDMDGGGGIEGCATSNEMINLTVELLRRGYTPGQLQKIWGGNLRRVTDAAQAVK